MMEIWAGIAMIWIGREWMAEKEFGVTVEKQEETDTVRLHGPGVPVCMLFFIFCFLHLTYFKWSNNEINKIHVYSTASTNIQHISTPRKSLSAFFLNHTWKCLFIGKCDILIWRYITECLVSVSILHACVCVLQRFLRFSNLLFKIQLLRKSVDFPLCCYLTHVLILSLTIQVFNHDVLLSDTVSSPSPPDVIILQGFFSSFFFFSKSFPSEIYSLFYSAWPN